MTDPIDAGFAREGQPAFPETEETETPAGSSPDKPEEETDSPETPAGEEPTPEDPDKDKPFHQHPRWLQREEEWKTRFNTMETRHQQEIETIRKEFGERRQDNADQVAKMPSWFGGSQEQWEEYCTDQDKIIQQAEERAVARITNAKQTEDKAVKEATEYMQAEMAAIESDQTLNPKGTKIDPNKLLQFVLDNDLVDSKGRWNYRAGFRLMTANDPAPTPPKPTIERKKVAAAVGSEPKAETTPSPVKTSADFKKSRPW